ncbi:MAG: VWA domain-containing protein [Rhodospirillales bacterium]|nr:VWA domain-containing protein [Rhodospirillales bacterium]
MAERNTPLIRDGGERDVAAFLEALARTPSRGDGAGKGRLLFGLDATGSRQQTWDRAARLQAEMFLAAAGCGGLVMQICFYRGFGEFRVGRWTEDGGALVRMMSAVACRAGETQIIKVLEHALNVARHERLAAVVFVGDCCEESIDRLAGRAGELGLLGVPAFMFHEGDDAHAATVFREVARLSGGAYCQFDSSSAEVLKDLLCAVAVFAAGGRQALDRLAITGGEAVRRIAHQMQRR